MNPIGLYLHIPFCQARCGYCDFATYTNQEHQVDRYLQALLKESQKYPALSVETLFVGGGTPTILNPTQIGQLFTGLRKKFDFSNLKEATVEANPESATEDRMSAFREFGFNRISFGLQATQNNLLLKMDRLHTWETFQDRFRMARNIGFDNVSVDLIFGLPGQSMDDWRETLEQITDLKPNHVSLYALKIEPGTPFDNEGITVDGDLQADMYLYASDYLRGKNFSHYEISNFSTAHSECQHNLKYWTNQETVGLGLSSASFFNGQRMTNPRSLSDYLDMIEKATSRGVQNVRLDPEFQKKEDVMLSLRLQKGLPWESIKKLNLSMVDTFLQEGLATKSEGRFFLNPKGWLMSNQLFQHLV